MDPQLVPFLAVGWTAVLAASGLLVLMVRDDLGPAARLRTGDRWLLVAALGMGVFAFSLKMTVASVVGRAPQAVVAPWTAGDGAPQPPRADEAGEGARPPYVWQALPWQAEAVDGDPAAAERIALGRRLFDERRLSADGTLACSSCHDLLGRAGADGRRTARGIGGQGGPRNVPTVWNAAFQQRLFWDGRAGSLEAQAAGPILNPIEMGLASEREAERRLQADPSYRAAFARAFGDAQPIRFEHIVQAIAAYERTLVTPDTPYDRFVRGEAGALSAAQLRGMALFESVGCVVCHRGPNFSDASRLGGSAPWRLFPANPTSYDTKYALLDARGQPGLWRVPSLRNVALTGPWLHHGAVDSLDEVVRIMASAQLGRTGRLTGALQADGSLGTSDTSPLSEAQVADLVAFLEALSSDSLRSRMAAAPR